MELAGSNVAVVGIGAENTPLIQYLVRAGAAVTACDRKPLHELGRYLEALEGIPVRFSTGKDYLKGVRGADLMFLTPGMRKDLPEIESERARGAAVTNQMSLFFELCPGRLVGITGSSGKTTTTTLVGEILRASGGQVFVAGNIGAPPIARLDEMSPTSWVVLELSSFQLELMHKSPHVAVITNISPNHLDMHPSMEHYVDAKKSIFRSQGPYDFLVLNLDNPLTENMRHETPSRVVWFSRRQAVDTGAFIEDGIVFWRSPGAGGATPVCRTEEVRLLGVHNLENVVAAVAASGLCGAGPEDMRRAIASFTGVPHRLELVREVDGVRFYNDSIATTPTRAAAGIRAFDSPVVLIAGGYDKHLPFEELVEAAEERVRHLVLVGATAEKIREAFETGSRGGLQPGSSGASLQKAGTGLRVPFLDRAGSFEDAVTRAWQAARPGEVVLLSPGCASYDMFTNFEERGKRFRELVAALPSKTQGEGNARWEVSGRSTHPG